MFFIVKVRVHLNIITQVLLGKLEQMQSRSRRGEHAPNWDISMIMVQLVLTRR